ncbi:uncharacterized protein LOC123540491 isoform X2 [Mercenaria mercenaria]|uniref:uncharacterized protein LOC123540491 isoform X2 n=1 Tax=Mercenaria mercenaria TaxID=6596 RepID=UPI00234F23E0|nr:uncharacterized protein LOC123540491 isoform X2 [Mercenaria mercenaria]
MDMKTYKCPINRFHRLEYAIVNSEELHERFENIPAIPKNGDTLEAPNFDFVEINICKHRSESNYPASLNEIISDGNINDTDEFQCRRKRIKHNDISLMILSSSTKEDISDTDSIKVYVASGMEDEAKTIKYIKRFGSCHDIVTQKECISQAVCNLLERIALKSLKPKCESLNSFLHGNATMARKRTKSAALRRPNHKRLCKDPSSGVSMSRNKHQIYDVESCNHIGETGNQMSKYRQGNKDEQEAESLLEEMLALFDISNVPECDRPVATKKENKKISKKLRKSLFALSPSIKRIAYRYNKFYVYAVKERKEYEMERNQKIRDVLKEHGIDECEIAPCSEHIKELSHVGAKIRAGETKYGTLSCFINIRERRRRRERQGFVLSKHVAQGCTNVYIANGRRRQLGTILPETNRYEHGSLDIAAAELHEEIRQIDTTFRDSRADPLNGCLHRYTGADKIVRTGRKVHIWGANSRPGLGVITAPEVIYDGMKNPLIQVEDKDVTDGMRFAEEGDSGAIVCADDPDKKCVHALAMVVGTPTDETGEASANSKREYLTLPLSKGFEQIEKAINGDIELI